MSVIITVLIVLGIIVAGGFLMYFLGDLFMGLAGKKKDSQVVNEKLLKEQQDLEARVSALENSDEARKDPAIAAILVDGDAIVEAYDPNEEVKEETEEVAEATEEVSEEVAEETAEEETVEEVEETEEAVEEEAEEEDDEDDTFDFIKQRRAELMERLAKMQEENEAEEESEEESVDLSEETAEEVEETEEAVEEVEETTEESASEETVETVEEKTEVKLVAAGPYANMSLEELEAKLVEEQENLKANEKELRQCKKEFIPLRRVKKTLESDEKKLRRKEALVAKQKVVLYGVNNYADIDEEKAKKLAEDLDLLDGLKLSVQHCQEVMDKNEERYPLLEKIFNLLSSQNEEIKSDIQNLQDAIAALKDEETPTDAE